jgi:tRNA dimethylallyltransferase
MKQLALIGPTASGKTALSIRLAQKLDAVILSLDSLAIYKQIDIASAKPTIEERAGIPHYGIDLLLPNEGFDVTTYMALYRQVVTQAKATGKNLIIVGGTSFYLKMLIEGISELPTFSAHTIKQTAQALKSLGQSHAMLAEIDPLYMKRIEPTDRYRIEKALNIYHQTGQTPTAYFKTHPPRPAISEPLPCYQITIDRAVLREKIFLRTGKMLAEGLIDEVAHLEKQYGRSPNSMKSIGIKETLDFLDGRHSRERLLEKISINTARLAKRQATFNRSQFDETYDGTPEEIYQKICVNYLYGIF